MAYNHTPTAHSCLQLRWSRAWLVFGFTAIVAGCGSDMAAGEDSGGEGSDIDRDGDGFTASDDCDDSDPLAHPNGFGNCPAPVDLGAAESFVILAKSGVSTVPASVVTGDIGLSPAAATFLTGFSLIADASDVFATSTQVEGDLYASDYAAPTPMNLTTAVSDMETAYTDAAGRAADVTELGAGNISGMTLEPGVYKWGTGLLVSSDLTLTGGAGEVWIFQIGQDLTVGNGANVTLAGGALPANVFWQVAGTVELGTTAHFEGVILTQTAVTMSTGASLNGRLYAQTAVSINSSTVTAP
jgi:Ice-binding-like